jgi:hypothetical protein
MWRRSWDFEFQISYIFYSVKNIDKSAKLLRCRIDISFIFLTGRGNSPYE